MSSKRIKLDFPISSFDAEGKEATISSVKLGRVKVKHLRSLPKETMTRLTELQDSGKKASLTIEEALPILQAITGLTNSEIDELDVSDLEKIQTAMEEDGFLS